MKTTYLALLFFALLMSGFEVHAEGGCPPGQYPQQGQGWKTCVPMPTNGDSQQPSQPMPKWYPRSGAIAADGDLGILGSADNERSRSDAEKKALLDCKTKGGRSCALETSYTNACGVMTVGDKGYAVASGQMKDEAISNSMNVCEKAGYGGCHVYFTGCSNPSLDK